MLEKLIAHLALENQAGWVPASAFSSVVGPRGALRRAYDEMGVRGAFGTWEQPGTNNCVRRFVPLLYIAEASDVVEAREVVHRRVWSQGLVPLLAICTPSEVYISEGYGYSSKDWEAHVVKVSGEDLSHPALERIRPKRLMSSVAWRDFAINPLGRVDRRLLSTLSALSDALTKRSNAPRPAANALIGRFLYFYILRDRKLLTDTWMQEFGLPDVFEIRTPDLTVETVWAVFDALDEMLNGTIFPLSVEDRAFFNEVDMHLLRDCIKLGDSLQSDGRQLSFLDFDISSLQTETLSAIYEQFLESEDSDAKRRDGVFYTPPFLADFVLDRIEEEVPLTASTRIIDCTAGSGVFIVGAYRRVIESAIEKERSAKLSAEALRRLLLSSIFGIEKSPSAHAVAAFSLYLTMLEYVDPVDIEKCLSGHELTPLFPPLAKQNLICADAFSIEAPLEGADKFDVVVGNPPWQKIDQITDRFDKVKNSLSAKVDFDEAAEYTLWWATAHLAKPSGIVALIIPAKSLISPSAKRFPESLSCTLDVVGVVNFAHFRYQLFANARQAACAILVRNQAPRHDSVFWSYSPTRAHMPGPESAPPWVLAYDRAQVQYMYQRELRNNDASWFEQIMLRPLDRYIRRYLFDKIEVGDIPSLAHFLKNENIGIGKGGSPSQTNLSSDVIYGADKFETKSPDFRNAPGVVLIEQAEQLRLIVAAQPDNFTDHLWLNKVDERFHRRFSGNCLLIPRSMQGLAIATQPIAFNSSLNAIYFKDEPADELEISRRETVLQAIGTYLASPLAQYLFAIFGRLWILDRTRLEKNDLLGMPIPFNSVQDPLIEEYLKSSDASRTELACRRFALPVWLIDAIREYMDFRQKFEDGRVPERYADVPTLDEIKKYNRAIGAVLRPVSEKFDIPRVLASNNLPQDGHSVISIELSSEKRKGAASFPDFTSPFADFSDSALLRTEDDQSILFLKKPRERFRWTIESAYLDGIQIIRKLMEEAHG